MKKLLIAVGLGLLSGTLYAACMGPFCYDDTGASVSGYAMGGNGNVLPSASSTTIAGIVPVAKFQFIGCTTCLGNSSTAGGNVLCYSTATAAGSFVIANSTAPVCK